MRILILITLMTNSAWADEHDADAIEWVCKVAIKDRERAQKYLTEKTEHDGDYEIQVEELCDLDNEEEELTNDQGE